MNTFNNFLKQETVLLEDAAHLKTHLSHIEDLAIEKGKSGFQEFTDHIDAITKKLKGFETNQEMNAKIDGSPMILFGEDPRPQFKKAFFISLKGGLSKTNPKIMHTDEEIESMYSGESTLKNKLKSLLKNLKPIYRGTKIYQGDVLFSIASDKKAVKIGEESFIAFKPNVIVYAVPVDPNSELSSRISKATVGVIVHESFNGRSDNKGTSITLQSTGRNVQDLVEQSKGSNVFIESSNYTSLKADISDQQLKKVHSDTAKAKLVITEIDDDFNNAYISSPLLSLLKIFLNKQVDIAPAGIFGAASRGEEVLYVDFLRKFREFISDRYNKELEQKKTPRGKAIVENRLKEILNFLEKHKDSLTKLLMATYYMTAAKYHVLRSLAAMESKVGKTFMQNPDGSFTPTKDEGFVLFMGTNHVKLVDRLEFTKINRLRGGKQKQELTA